VINRVFTIAYIGLTHALRILGVLLYERLRDGGSIN
jgi:hypothetical protein